MKILYKLIVVLLISALSSSGGYYFAYKTVKKDKEVVVTEKINLIEKDRFAGAIPHRLNEVGNSMYPSISDGDTVFGYEVEPINGDVVSFENHKKGSLRVTKRLIKIREDGAWWVLGDNRTISHDSGDYGWILPSERSNVWIVKVN